MISAAGRVGSAASRGGAPARETQTIRTDRGRDGRAARRRRGDTTRARRRRIRRAPATARPGPWPRASQGSPRERRYGSARVVGRDHGRHHGRRRHRRPEGQRSRRRRRPLRDARHDASAQIRRARRAERCAPGPRPARRRALRPAGARHSSAYPRRRAFPRAAGALRRRATSTSLPGRQGEPTSPRSPGRRWRAAAGDRAGARAGGRPGARRAPPALPAPPPSRGSVRRRSVCVSSGAEPWSWTRHVIHRRQPRRLRNAVRHAMVSIHVRKLESPRKERSLR